MCLVCYFCEKIVFIKVTFYFLLLIIALVTYITLITITFLCKRYDERYNTNIDKFKKLNVVGYMWFAMNFWTSENKIY